MYYPSGYFKAKARDALKGCWQTALLIALIVNLPGLLAQGISVFTGNDPVHPAGKSPSDDRKCRHGFAGLFPRQHESEPAAEP